MKTEAIKRLINAVDFWVACGVFDGTNFNPNTDDAKNELEQLALHNVVGQSEQYCDCDKPTLGNNVWTCGCGKPFKKKGN